jgi:tetratricopeptide (TPR) repeat protein
VQFKFSNASKSSLFLFCIAAGLCLSKLSSAAPSQSQEQDYSDLVARAQAKTAAKEWVDAAKLWEKVVEMNPVRGSTWHQLANAHHQANDYRKAIPAYEKTLELGFWPAHMAHNVARCYAMLGQNEEALRWLEKALALRFNDLMLLQSDPELESLRHDARFQKLVGLVDASKMSREQGWRYDLDLFRREIERKGYSPYRKMSKEQFDAAVRKLQGSVAKLSDVQVIIEMMKLMRMVGDGHSAVWMTPERPEFRTALPVQFYLFVEGLFVIATDPKHSDLLGAQVLRFGNRTVNEVLVALDPLMERDNEMGPKVTAPSWLRHPVVLNGLGLIPDAQSVSLTLRNMDGGTRTVTLSTNSPDLNIKRILPKAWVSLPEKLEKPVPLYIKNRHLTYWFEHLPQAKTVYFQFNSVRNDPQEPLDALINRLFKFINESEVEKLIIDMRWNNGGNTVLAQPLIHRLISNEKINQRGKLFVIIGRRTFSAAQNTATFIERHTNAIFVGEPTGAGPNFIGEEDPVTLPYSKIPINVSDVFWQSSWPFDQRTWIGPEIYVPPTFEAYRANRDPALEAILAYRTKP